MKHDETPLLPPDRLVESLELGAKLSRLRIARKLRQADVALRAAMARSTVALIEKGDPGRTLAQVLRYLEVVAPGLSLQAVLQESDPSLSALRQAETTRRVRPLSAAELKKLDF